MSPIIEYNIDLKLDLCLFNIIKILAFSHIYPGHAFKKSRWKLLFVQQSGLTPAVAEHTTPVEEINDGLVIIGCPNVEKLN